MQKSNNLEEVINDAFKEAKTKWSKTVPSLHGKQAKRHITLLALLIIYGPQTTWDLAKLYLERIEKLKAKNPQTFFYYRAKENSIIHRRLKFLESKHYVRKEGSVYYPTVKAWFLLLVVNPQLTSILPLNRFSQTIEELSLEPENEQFLTEFDKQNEPQLPNIIDAFKNFFSNHATAKALSETVRACFWSLKINIDELETKEFMNLILSQVRKAVGKAKSSKTVTINLPEG